MSPSLTDENANPAIDFPAQSGGLNNRPLLWRVMMWFALAACALAVAVSAAVIYWVYEHQAQAFQQRLDRIERGYRDSLATSVWTLNEVQIEAQLRGIMNLPRIQYVRLSDGVNLQVELGQRPHSNQVNRITLEREQHAIAHLEVAFDHQGVLDDAIDAAIASLWLQLLTIALLTVIMAFIVQRLINRRLEAIAEHMSSQVHQDQVSEFNSADHGDDEIHHLIQAYNTLSRRINIELNQRRQAQQQLALLNTDIEQRVNLRNEQLQQQYQQLLQQLEQRQQQQDQEQQDDKLNTLSNMVASLAHEINTPLGLSLTLHSLLRNQLAEFEHQFRANLPPAFQSFNQEFGENMKRLQANLRRASDLLQSFRHISEEQLSEHVRDFALRPFLLNVTDTLAPTLKHGPHQVDIDCSEALVLRSCSASVSQVVTNLIINSVQHAFADGQQGRISITVAEERGQIIIHYRDNGCGLTPEVQAHIFEPFFSTKQGKGGSGLGMHLVYTIVRQRLQGDIRIENTPQQGGCSFRITLPKIHPVSISHNNVSAGKSAD